MLLTLLLAAALVPTPQEPQDESPRAPSELREADLPEASPSLAQGHIDAGLAAFKRRRFSQAEIEFRQAVEADPQSAAAAFYLGYTYYKMAEPKRPNHPGKQRAADLFAKAYALDPSFAPVWRSR